METANTSDFLLRLTRGMCAEALADRSDRQLVDRALTGCDEAAFQALVLRHGPMVYRVGWRVLRHAQDAEDAYQATFLILARKLRGVRHHASLAGWLHGVARRVALKARARSAARRRREELASPREAPPPGDAAGEEVWSILDEELGRLPEKWRLPLILCYLEGRTQDEAADRLGWSKSTLRRRLQEGRNALGRRLKGRGVVWPAALSAILLSDCVAPAVPGPGFTALALQATPGQAAASTEAAALAAGVLRTMVTNKLRLTSLALFFGLITAGIGGVSYTALAAGQAEGRPQPRPENKQLFVEMFGEPRLLVDTARKLDDARENVRQAEEALEQAKKKLDIARGDYTEAEDRFESARAKRWAKDEKVIRGELVRTNARANSVDVEYFKTTPEFSTLAFQRPGNALVASWTTLTTEPFSVAKDAEIVQDNVRTMLADLKPGHRVAVRFRGKEVAGIRIDGGLTRGWYVSANEGRHTVTVATSAKDEQKQYHLVPETEITAADGGPMPLKDLVPGALLLLTRSVEDPNTVIRIEMMPPVGGR